MIVDLPESVLSYRISGTMIFLPQPLEPTRAIFSPGLALKDTPFKIFTSFLKGYLK